MKYAKITKTNLVLSLLFTVLFLGVFHSVWLTIYPSSVSPKYARVDVYSDIIKTNKNPFLLNVSSDVTLADLSSSDFHGYGYRIEKEGKETQFKIVSNIDSDIVIELKGPLVLENGEPKKHWINFRELSINNGKNLLDSSVSAWYGCPYKYKLNVKKGQNYNVKVRWKRSLRNFVPFDVDWYLFFIIATLAFLLSSKIVSYLVGFKIYQFNSRIDIVFLSAFFVLLFIPLTCISESEKLELENRMLAKYVPLIQNGKINLKYGVQFEKWFNDRFGGRNLFLDVYNRIENFLTRYGNDKVLVGFDNWLFYKEENSLRNFQNLDLFSVQGLENAAAYLSAIDDWAKKHNKKFYFLIFPDKNKIYGEFIRGIKLINSNDNSRANQLINYLKTYTSVNVIYPYNELIQEKENALLYWKNDTHWNELGAYVAYKKIFDAISADYSIDFVKYDSLKKIKKEWGDLSNKFPSVGKDFETEYSIPIIDNKSKCDESIDNMSDVICVNPSANYNVYVYRDSFMSALSSYLNNTFKEVHYFWRYELYKADLEMFEDDADIIILEMVERYIQKLATLEFPED